MINYLENGLRFSIYFICIVVLFACSENQDYKPKNEVEEFDLILADILGGNDGAIIRIDPTSGEQTILSEDGRFQSGPWDVVVDVDGMIYTTVTDVPGSPPEIVRVDTSNGVQTTISSGGYLKSSIYGIAIESSGDLLVAKGRVQYDLKPRLLRIDKTSGEQEIVSEGDMFADISDVVVNDSDEIYVLGAGGQTINAINSEVATLFKVDPITGEQSVLFWSQDYSLSQMAIDKDGSIIAVGQAIIRIQTNGQHEEIISRKEGVVYDAIAISRNGDVFVAKHLYSPISHPSVCRLDVTNGTLEPFSFEYPLEFPSGMDILYTK